MSCPVLRLTNTQSRQSEGSAALPPAETSSSTQTTSATTASITNSDRSTKGCAIECPTPRSIRSVKVACAKSGWAIVMLTLANVVRNSLQK